MDTLTALVELQKAGFRHVISGGGLTFYDRPVGPFAVRVEHDAKADELAMRLALTAAMPSHFKEWSFPLRTPAILVAEALNFIRVFESSACVGGD